MKINKKLNFHQFLRARTEEKDKNKNIRFVIVDELMKFFLELKIKLAKLEKNIHQKIE